MLTISKTAYFSKVALFIHVNKLSDNSYVAENVRGNHFGSYKIGHLTLIFNFDNFKNPLHNHCWQMILRRK